MRAHAPVVRWPVVRVLAPLWPPDRVVAPLGRYSDSRRVPAGSYRRSSGTLAPARASLSIRNDPPTGSERGARQKARRAKAYDPAVAVEVSSAANEPAAVT